MKELKKHKFNILPKIDGEDYKKLENDLKANGYDLRFPIFLYEGDIIDGWGRYQICQNLGIIPVYETFEGTEIEAIQFMLRTNKRRSLTSSQWAAVANEATDIINAIEKLVRERTIQSQTEAGKMYGKGRAKTEEKVRDNNIPDLRDKGKASEPSDRIIISSIEDKGKTSEKLAEIFPTSPAYIQQAKRIKKEHPEEFEKIKSGEKTIPQVRREQAPKPKTDESNPFFYETVRLVNRAGDHVERILQKEFVPKTLKDFGHIDSLNHGLYRFVRLAGEAGVNIVEVWEKLSANHGMEIQKPEQLKRPSDLEEN